MGNKNTVADVSITHSCNISSVNDSANHQLSAANKAASGKYAKYIPDCLKSGYDFLALIFETYGAIHKDAYDLIIELASRHSALGRIPKSVCIQYWFTRFSVALQVSNAKMFISKINRVNNKNIMSYAIINPSFQCDTNAVVRESCRNDD